MKILMVHPNWKAYSEVWLHRMIGYLEDDIVGMACFSPLEKRWNKKIECFDLYGKKPGRLKHLFSKLRIFQTLLHSSVEKEFVQFVEEKKPDIIFINFIGPALYLKKALDRLQLPVFIHVHGVDVFWDAKDELSSSDIHPGDYKKSLLSLAQSNYKVHFIANSRLSKAHLLAIDIPETKISLKYFGVPSHDGGKVFREKNMRILYLGRFVDFKGPDIVVNAFIKACDLGFDGTLSMYGNGPLKIACQLIAKRSKYAERIYFGNPVEPAKAAELFKQADIFTMHNCEGILSNQVEAFGVTIIEAMSHGLPVVTGRCGGPTEIITDRHDGLLIEPGDIDSHANAFTYLQKDISFLQQLGRNGLETVKKHFLEGQERKALIDILHNNQN